MRRHQLRYRMLLQVEFMHEILPGSTGKVARQLRRVLQSTDWLDSKRAETSKDRIFGLSVRGGEEP